MAHYAFINTDNIVVEVITGIDETDTDTLPEEFASWEEFYATQRDGLTCKRTSYNTQAGEHLNGGTAFRGNYAGIGFTYDPDNDVFIAPKPYDSWILDSNTWTWVAPLDLPNDANGDIGYYWDEDLHQTDSTLGWVLVT